MFIGHFVIMCVYAIFCSFFCLLFYEDMIKTFEFLDHDLGSGTCS